MPGPTIKHDLQNFLEFATRRIERGEKADSVEDLVEQWRSDSDYAAAVADVRQGNEDVAVGRAEPMADAFAEIRRRLGMDK